MDVRGLLLQVERIAVPQPLRIVDQVYSAGTYPHDN